MIKLVPNKIGGGGELKRFVLCYLFPPFLDFILTSIPNLPSPLLTTPLFSPPN